jgi:arsenate reductase (thioredoxin)
MAERVIFACVHNAGRSQMAAAFFSAMVPADRAQALSAGTEPGSHVHPEVAEAMREIGIDLSNATPRRLTPEMAEGASWLITMGCAERCPVVPGARRDDWPLDDPKGLPVDRVREIRDEIRDRVRDFARTQGWVTESEKGELRKQP